MRHSGINDRRVADSLRISNRRRKGTDRGERRPDCLTLSGPEGALPALAPPPWRSVKLTDRAGVPFRLPFPSFAGHAGSPALAPLLFDDHDPAAAERRRASVVAPARRSPADLARRKRTADDLPVHSFPDPAHRPGYAGRQHHAGRRRRQHLHPADRTRRRSSSAASSSWRSSRTCSQYRNHPKRRNRQRINDVHAISSETSG